MIHGLIQPTESRFIVDYRCVISSPLRDSSPGERFKWELRFFEKEMSEPIKRSVLFLGESVHFPDHDCRWLFNLYELWAINNNIRKKNKKTLNRDEKTNSKREEKKTKSATILMREGR